MRISRLEAARGGAALYVMLHHAVPRDLELYGLPVSYLFRFGQEAVILFFLLSGFVIAHSVNGKPLNPLAFLRARFLRIFVPLLPALALSYFARAVITGALPDPDLAALLGNLAMTQDLTNLPGTWTAPYMGNTPLWSLSYEWWFYLAFLLLMMMARSWAVRTAIVTGLALLAAAIYPTWPDWSLRVTFSMSIWWTGVLVAKAWSEKRLDGWQGLLPAIPLGATAVVLTLSVGLTEGFAGRRLGEFPLIEIRRLAAGLVIFLAALGWRAIGWRGFDRVGLTVAWVAPISYGLYIVHRPFLLLGERFSEYIGALPAMILAVGASLIMAWIIERGIYVRIESLVPKFQTHHPIVSPSPPARS